MSSNTPQFCACWHDAPWIFNFFISHGWTFGQSWEIINWKILPLHLHRHCWRHRFGAKGVNHHIWPCHLSQQLVTAKADNTLDLKVRRVFALEATRNHTVFLHMQRRFLEFICSSVKQYPAILCVDMIRLGFSIIFISTAGPLDSHGN